MRHIASGMMLMAKWNLTVVVTILTMAAIMTGAGTFATNTRGALGYSNRLAADDNQAKNFDAIVNEARMNTIRQQLCTHQDSNSLCGREHEEAPVSPVRVIVPVKVIVPINNTNTNNNINQNNNNNKNNNTSISSTPGYAGPENNSITINIPPIGITSQQMVPNLGTVFVSTTLPDPQGYCARGQFHAISNAGPVCLSISLIK